MRTDVANDLTKSAEQFTRLVWPAISDRLGGGRLVTLESADAPDLAALLDMQAGVDAIQVHPSGRLRLLACRVQPTGYAWDTFTIRRSRATGSETEYEKRLLAVETFDAHGYLYPAITVQAYTTKDGSRLLSAGMVRTRDLYTYVKSVLAGAGGIVQERTTGADGNTFYVVRWDDLSESGVLVAQYTDPFPVQKPA